MIGRRTPTSETSRSVRPPAVCGLGPVVACLVVALMVAAVLPADALAQASEQAAGAREMRHFWHVFIAFALAWILVFGWAVAIARRLRRVEDTLE